MPNALTSNRDGSTISALEALRNALYKFKTYLLTYLLTSQKVIAACMHIHRETKNKGTEHAKNSACTNRRRSIIS